MSVHTIPTGVDIGKLDMLLARFLRPHDGYRNPDGSYPIVAGQTQLAFEPDLTAAEQAILAAIFALSHAPHEWSPADYAVFAAERPTLAAYLVDSSPTAAETVAAIKSLTRIVAAIVRTA